MVIENFARGAWPFTVKFGKTNKQINDQSEHRKISKSNLPQKNKRIDLQARRLGRPVVPTTCVSSDDVGQLITYLRPGARDLVPGTVVIAALRPTNRPQNDSHTESRHFIA